MVQFSFYLAFLDQVTVYTGGISCNIHCKNTLI